MEPRIYQLGKGNAWLGKCEKFLTELAKRWRSSVHIVSTPASLGSSASRFLSILSLATCRWHTESVCLGLCLCLAALGNPAGIQHRSGHGCSSLLSSRVVTSSPPRYRAVAGVSAAVIFVRKTACSKALPYGHTAGTLQGHLWEKSLFLACKSRS